MLIFLNLDGCWSLKQNNNLCIVWADNNEPVLKPLSLPDSVLINHSSNSKAQYSSAIHVASRPALTTPSLIVLTARLSNRKQQNIVINIIFRLYNFIITVQYVYTVLD